MTAEVIRMVDSREGEQKTRFQWRETFDGFIVVDMLTLETRGMGDGVDMFGPAEDDEEAGLSFVPGTARFYDTLNAYFAGEQTEIAQEYFNVSYKEGGHDGH